MSRFKVGNRVRIKFCYNAFRYGNYSGKEATVIGHRFLKDGRKANELSIDGYGEIRKDGRKHAFYDEQLEPLTDSYDLASWDTCIWKPEHLRVKV